MLRLSTGQMSVDIGRDLDERDAGLWYVGVVFKDMLQTLSSAAIPAWRIFVESRAQPLRKASRVALVMSVGGRVVGKGA